MYIKKYIPPVKAQNIPAKRHKRPVYNPGPSEHNSAYKEHCAFFANDDTKRKLTALERMDLEILRRLRDAERSTNRT